MILGKKVRLYPTEEQEQNLWKSVGTARFIYNWTLSKQQENYALRDKSKNGSKFISDNDLRKEITLLKKTEEFSWLNEVSNNVAKQAVKDACEAYKRFFKGQSNFPKFKSRKRSKPSFYNDTDKLKVKEKLVLVEKVGWIRTNEQIPMNVKYNNPRVSFDGKYWYLAVGIEREKIQTELSDAVTGIDVGVKELAVCSDGQVFENINKSKAIKKFEKKLHRLQRKISRKYEKNKKGKEYAKTSNIIKLEKQIKLVYRKLANIRANHIHQTTNKIVKTKPSKVVMEALNIKGMMKNKHLSKAIADQGLYEFVRQMKYKCEFNGIKFDQADKWYASSKICSKCDHKKVKLSMSERVYKCERCGLEIDRDYNASINLSKYQLA